MSNHHLTENLQRLLDSWNARGRNLEGAERALISRIGGELASVMSAAGRSHLVSVRDYEMVWRKIPQVAMVHMNAKNPMLRQIAHEEVVFTATIEPEETPVRDKYIQEEDLDRTTEGEILERLDRGELKAWCTIIVTASWKARSGHVHTGSGSVGCVVLDAEYTARSCINSYGLEQVALENLNKKLAALVSRYQQLLAELAPACPDTRQMSTEMGS
jgi:hypothetical protein